MDYKINIERIGGHRLSNPFFFLLLFVIFFFSFRLLGGINHQIMEFFGSHCLSKAGTDVPEMERS